VPRLISEEFRRPGGKPPATFLDAFPARISVGVIRVDIAMSGLSAPFHEIGQYHIRLRLICLSPPRKRKNGQFCTGVARHSE
jgi:hypothetical protein